MSSNRNNSKNPNWKGGISSIKSADTILSLPMSAKLLVKDRLLSQYLVDHDTGCWNWTGGVFKSNGRACLTLGSRLLASRLVWVLFYKKPIGSLCVLHSCDNVLCIRPSHLFLGTNADNSADMVRKGRSATGDRNGARKHP